MRKKLEFVVNTELEDIRFMSWSTIAIFTVAVCLLLLFLFPKSRLNFALAHQDKPSAITADYLKILLSSDPNNAHIRALYAQQLVGLNEFASAKVQIQKLHSAGSGYQVKASFLEYQIERTQYYAEDEKSPGRLAEEKKLRENLARINDENLDPNQLMMLLEDASNLNEKGLAKRFLEKLKPWQSQLQPLQAVKIALYALRVSDYQASAEYYFIAQHKSRSLPKIREYFLAALRSLEMGNQVKLAVELGRKNLGVLENDPVALNYLTRLSLQVSEFDEAQKSVTKSIGLELKKP